MNRNAWPLLRNSVILVNAMGLFSPALAETYLYPNYGGLTNFDTRYKAISVGSGPAAVDFAESLNYSTRGYQHFRRVIAGDAGNSSPTDIQFRGFNNTLLPEGKVNLTIGSLELNQTNLNLNRVNLIFGAPDSTLSLTNARLTSNEGVLLADQGSGSFRINALGGDNLISGRPGSQISQIGYINVSPGATLTFRNFNGGSAYLADDTRHLLYTKMSYFNVDAGRLTLDSTRMVAHSGNLVISNGAAFEISGSAGSGGRFNAVDLFSGSGLSMGQSTDLSAIRVSLRDGSSADLAAEAKLTATSFFVSGGDNLINGPGATPGNMSPSSIDIQFLTVTGGATTFQIAGVSNISVGEAEILASGMSIQNGSLQARKITLKSGLLELGDDAQLTITAPGKDNSSYASPASSNELFPVPPSSKRTDQLNYLASTEAGSELRLQAAARLNIAPGAMLVLDDPSKLKVSNDGLISVDGLLIGQGVVEGAGAVTIGQGAYLRPDAGRTIHFDNALSLQTDSRLVVTLPSNGTLPTQAAVTYGARPVTFDGKPIIEVRGTGSLSATTLDGQAIPVIAAQARGVAGTIQTNGLTPTVQAVNMPALIKYSVADTGTNGKPDVTLIMDRLPVDDIKRNPALTGRNRQGVANLAVAAAASSPAVNQALNTVTNEQLAGNSASGSGGSTAVLAAGSRGYFDQLHAEPYSSFITTNLELTANIRNQVFTRAMDTDPSGRRVWGDFGESRGRIEGSNDLGSFKYSLSNLSFGKDLGTWLGGAWGGYFTYAQARMNEHDIASQSLSGQNASGGLYAQWRQPGWETRVLMSYGYGRHSSTRTYSHDGLSENFTANFNSHTLQAGFRTSFDWIDQKGFELRPEIGGSITRYRQEGFSEQGNPAFGLSVASQDAAAYIVHAGLNARMPRIRADVPVRPVAFARIERDFASNSEHSVIAGLQSNPGTTETFYGQGRGPTTATLGIGLMSEDLGRWQVSGGLVAARHTNGSEWGAGFRVSYFW